MASIAIGCDEAALELKDTLRDHLRERGYDVEDYGVHSPDPVDYPDIALQVAEAVAHGRHEQAVLCCGTGIGMSITANKVPGVRAAQVSDTYSAAKARSSNNAQILTMGGRTIGKELAKTLLDAWLDAEFDPQSSSARKVAKMNEVDEQHHETPTGARV